MPQEDDVESLGLQQAVEPIFELQSPAKVKPKGRLPGAKNKKRSVAQADLERSTERRNLSRFEHEAKTEKAGMRSQDNTRAKGRQRRTEQGRGDGHKRIEHQAKRPKHQLITRALIKKREK